MSWLGQTRHRRRRCQRRLAVALTTAGLVATAGCGQSANIGNQAAADFRAWAETHPLPAGEIAEVNPNNALPYVGDAAVTIAVPRGTDPVPVWRHVCGYEPEHPTTFGFVVEHVEIATAPCDGDPSVWAALVTRLLEAPGLEEATAVLERHETEVVVPHRFEVLAQVTDGPDAAPRDRTAVAALVAAVRDVPEVSHANVLDDDEGSSFRYEESSSDPAAVRRALDAVLHTPVRLRSLAGCDDPEAAATRRVCVELRPTTDGGGPTDEEAVRSAARAVDPSAEQLLLVETDQR